MEHNKKFNKRNGSNNSQRNARSSSALIPNYNDVLRKHLMPIYGEGGLIQPLVDFARRSLVPVLDNLASDPAKLHQLFKTYLYKTGSIDLAETMQCFRDLRNRIVHKKIVEIGFLRNAIHRTLAFCAWIRQQAVITAVAPSHDVVLDLQKRVIALAEAVQIQLPTHLVSNVTLKPTTTVSNNLH